MATQSSILAWRIPWTGEPGRLQSMGLQSWKQLSNYTELHTYPVWASQVALMVKNPSANAGQMQIPWRRLQRPTPVFLPGESHGQRSWVGYSPWGCKDSDTTEATKQAHIPFGNILLNVLSADDNHCENCKRVHCAPGGPASQAEK